MNNDDDDEKRAAHDLLRKVLSVASRLKTLKSEADEEKADQRAGNAAHPACQLRAAEGDDRDRIELEAEAKGR